MRIATLSILLLAIFATGGFCQTDEADQWANWRGPLQTGVAPSANPPIQWSEDKNIAWKTPLPGLGHSSPVVWDDRIYLTSARKIGEPFAPRPDTAPGAHDNKLVSSKFEFLAIAIDRKTGKVVWEKSLHSEIPHEGAHTSGSLASASPVTDGKHAYFHFGSYGTYCLDRDGKTVWKRDFGKMQTKHGHGEGSTPALHSDKLIINWDHEEQSFIAALDKKTGKTVWKIDRAEATSWSSPIIVDVDGNPQVIVSATEKIRGYDLENGKVIWSCGGLSNNVCASPVYEDGMLYAGSSYVRRMVMGINIRGAKGDLTNTDRIVWNRQERPPYVPSLLLVDDHLYYLRHYQGILTRMKAKTGETPTGPFRLGSMREIYCSPVATPGTKEKPGRIYVTDRSGHTVVISTNESADLIALNRLNDRFSASAAIVGRQMFLRGEKFLYCIAEPKKQQKEN